MLYLTNSDETHVIEEYIEHVQVNAAKQVSLCACVCVCLCACVCACLFVCILLVWVLTFSRKGVLTPCMRTVQRNGHCNVNCLERTAAMIELLSHLATSNMSALSPLYADLTRVIVVNDADVDSQHVVCFDDVGAWGSVTSTDAWGDLMITITPAHLKRLDIKPGIWAQPIGCVFLHLWKCVHVTGTNASGGMLIVTSLLLKESYCIVCLCENIGVWGQRGA